MKIPGSDDEMLHQGLERGSEFEAVWKLVANNTTGELIIPPG